VSEQPTTEGEDYASRLQTLGGARWKRILNVQAPYRWNLRRLELGRCLDVGCGIGRNLVSLPAGSIGVDHNGAAITAARGQGLTAYTSSEFPASPDANHEAFDSILFAHVVEHMDKNAALELIRTHLPYLRSGGLVVFITPQERGYTTDETHVRFVDFGGLSELAAACNLSPRKRYSFPFPRSVGKVFAYNEFVFVCEKG
jgi:2-polyprenyl-3-methyl-5-hydroxy-6-metoxy-1,4-benzoquinol methylase